jgi:hypothetical protein
MTQTHTFENLEQYDDYHDGEYLDKVVDKYSPLLGSFLLNFSILEQELNLAVIKFINNRSDEMGFMIIEKLTVSNKIDLFYKMYLRLESFKTKNAKKSLNKIKQQLEELNSFRNSIVHANWQSLTKNGFVRTKIIVDNQEGYVKFKKVETTPKIIKLKIKEIKKLIDQIDEYREIALQF